MGLIEKILDRNCKLPRQLHEPIPDRCDDVVCQGVAFDALDSLAESFGLVIEMVKNHFLQT
jgi:hypothetical protein